MPKLPQPPSKEAEAGETVPYVHCVLSPDRGDEDGGGEYLVSLERLEKGTLP